MRNLFIILLSALFLYLLCAAASIQYHLFSNKAAAILLFITGALVGGEALALAVGMRLPAGVPNSWLSVKNNAFLLLDILTGAAILAAAFGGQGGRLSIWLLVFTGAALLLHLYREWEYLSGFANAFCANRPLFIVNNVKLLGLLAVMALTAAYMGERPYMDHGGANAPAAEPVRYSVTASDMAYERLLLDDVVSLLGKYHVGIVIAVRENQLGEELDRLLDIYERNGIDVSFAPLLSAEQGKYLNKSTAAPYLDLTGKVLQWADDHRHTIVEIVADIEPSDTGGSGPYFDFGRFLGSMDKESFIGSVPEFQKIVSEIKSHGCAAVSCPTWFTIEDANLGISAWQDFFGGPSVSAGWDSSIIMMYSEWFLESGRIIGADRETANTLIYRYCSDMSRLWGGSGGVILGSVTGDKGGLYPSASDMSGAVAAAKAAGMKSICLYDLKGILESGEADDWFQMLTGTAPVVPTNRNLQARVYRDVFRLVSYLLNLREICS